MKRLAFYALLSYLAFRPQANGQGGIIPSQSLMTSPAQKTQLAEKYGTLPLSFEANTGQADKSVKFLSRGSGYGLYLTGEEAVLALREGGCTGLPAAGDGQTASAVRRPGLWREAACSHQTAVVRMRLGGSSGVAAPVGEEQLPGTANYLIGNDPAKWHTSVPTYAKVCYRSVYPGVDLVYYGNQRQIEYDFVVAPGTDPKSIRLQFGGAKGLRLAADGDLVVTAVGGTVAFHKPVVYQVVNGKRETVEGSFVLLAKHTVGFRLGSYHRGKALVIDPALVYSTYLGGSTGTGGFAPLDGASGIVADTAGNVFVTGSTSSTDFPVTNGAVQTTNSAAGGCSTPFVAKLNPTGSALVYSTYLGGSGCGDFAHGLAVDDSGNAYIAGETSSSNFPVTQGAFQTTKPKNRTGFVSKLNPTGSALIYSTYLGGSNGFAGDFASTLVVDDSGNTYIAGVANSTDFPVSQEAYQTTNRIVPDPSFGILTGTNAFVTKLNPTGSALIYSTYLGGSGIVFGQGLSTAIYGDGASGLAVDSGGNVYVTGSAYSTDFPVTVGAFQRTNHVGNSGYNAFVTKLNSTGTALVYSTYLGGGAGVAYRSGDGLQNALAVDGTGNAYVTGSAFSTDFPVTQGAFQTANHAAAFASNAFVTKLNPTGSALVYSTYLGGSRSDGASGLAVDSSGNAYITGTALSTDFPVTEGAFQTTNHAAEYGSRCTTCGGNAFVTKLNPTGSALVYSTYLGGSRDDSASGLAVDGSGNAYISGTANSADFPVTQGAFQTTNRAAVGSNAFVAKLNLGATLAGPSITSVAVANGGTDIAQNAWIVIKGVSLVPPTTPAAGVIWSSAPDFAQGRMPTQLGGVSVAVNGKAAFVYFYCSAATSSVCTSDQINVLTPLDSTLGPVPIVVTNNGTSTMAFTANMKSIAPAFLQFSAAGYVAATHADGALLGPTTLYPGASTPAQPGELIVVYGVGFGLPTTTLVNGSSTQSGPLPSLPVCQIGGNAAAVAFAGLISPGLYQFNLTVPSSAQPGDNPLSCTYNGSSTPSGALITVQQ